VPLWKSILYEFQNLFKRITNIIFLVYIIVVETFPAFTNKDSYHRQIHWLILGLKVTFIT
jgi:magnesium-transporting ATPase (P-type)/class 3 adenylate cyclase